MQRNENKKLEDIPCHELNRIFCHFYTEIQKKGSQDYEPRKFGCHGVLVRLSFKKTMAETTVFCKIVNLQIQGNNLKQKQENYEYTVTDR